MKVQIDDLELQEFLNSIIGQQRALLVQTIQGLPASKGVSHTANKLANELRIRQLTKEEGMQEFVQFLIVKARGTELLTN